MNVSRETHRNGSDPEVPPSPPEAASVIFGPRLARAERFAALLADTGVSHGLIGPREVPRLWSRHILNCAVVEAALPPGATIVDVGSGAGLPGLALALARPDLTLHLVEPMERRIDWLTIAVAELGLTDRVSLHRARAEECHGTLFGNHVTARAVAPIARLARWSLPLLRPGGTLVALKGRSVHDELDRESRELVELGVTSTEVVEYGTEILETPTTVAIIKGSPRARAGRGRRGRS